MKKTRVLLMILAALMLNGCASAKESLNEEIKQRSGVLDDEQYIQYQNYVAEGKVTQDGEYIEETAKLINEITGTIHVTFSNNNNLSIEYYKDEQFSDKIDTSNCYLNPGDKVYAKVTISQDIYSSMYEFAGFFVYEYKDNNRQLISKNEQTDTGLAFSIPVEFDGSELAIVPLGRYQERQIFLRDFCKDDNGNEYDVTGTWMIDEKEYEGDAALISAVSSYIISYKYDNDEYFYVASEPECYYNNNEDGIVIFKQREATDETVDYSVELHKYVSVSLVSDTDRKVSVNGEEEQKLKTNTELQIPHLKYGEYVTITTDKVWDELENNRELLFVTREIVDSKFKYTMVVAQKGGEFVFNPADYVYEHGTIEFTCFGEVVRGTQLLAEKTRIYYREASAEKGYWLASGENYIVVGDTESTIKKLKEIHFTPKVQVTVNLSQPEYGGKITYIVDGYRMSSGDFVTYSGTEITMEFDSWEGWKLSSGVKDGITYTVGENKNQVINVNGMSVNSVFTEDEGHMPELTVVLDKSVGKTVRFEFDAANLIQEEYTYVDKVLKSKYTLIDSIKIGTQKPIILTIDNKPHSSGKAIKIVIEKKSKDESKSEGVEIRYVDDLTKELKPIEIYPNNSNAISTVWYSEINITISEVEIKYHSNPVAGANTHVAVLKKNGSLLMAGEKIEPDDEVTVRIKPAVGYYITGRNVENDMYQATMKYSDYLSKFEDIRNNHPAAKIYRITLDTSDTFASYTYKLDGEIVEGTIDAREGQTLSLVYEIVSENYKLSESNGMLWWKTDKSVTEEIKISSELDGRTITKADFGIETVEGE